MFAAIIGVCWYFSWCTCKALLNNDKCNMEVCSDPNISCKLEQCVIGHACQIFTHLFPLSIKHI
jgi:hypothetical protein